MNPKHFQIRVCPNTRTLWLTHAKAGQTRRIKDIGQEVLWALCADLSVTQDEDSATTAIERSVVFADGMECRVTVELVKRTFAERSDA